MKQTGLAVVGLGPAGRALAHRALVRGWSVIAVDPAPERGWRPTYAGWARQLPRWLPAEVRAQTSSRTLLRAHDEHILSGDYVVLDTPGLQRALSLDGAELRTGLVDDEGLHQLAQLVVDCRGSHPTGGRSGAPGRDQRRTSALHGPAQTAWGIALPPHLRDALLGDADAVLMDWRPYDGRRRWGSEAPSFCYTVPLADGRILAEETCLAGEPALGLPDLARRLRARLARRGVTVDPAAGADVERVHIPLVPAPRRHGLPRFGAAGAQLNPISGYSVFASLARVDSLLDDLAAGRGPARGHQSPVRAAALGAVLRLAPDATLSLFDAFGRLPAADQTAIMDPTVDDRALVAAMARQWAAMPSVDKLHLVGATAAGAPTQLRRRKRTP